MPPPDHPAEDPTPQPATGAEKGHAWFWPPMPGTGPYLRDLGAPHRTAAPGPWPAYPRPGAAGSATPGTGRRYQPGPTRGFGHEADCSPRCAWAHPQAVRAAHPRQEAPP